MRSQQSLEEIAELYGLLENIKKEYQGGIHSVLRKSNPELFSNPHTIPKLKKISINRGLGLAAQNTNILKKSITEFTRITGQKPLITRAKKAVAGFKIRENMELMLASDTPKNFRFFRKSCLSTDLAPVMKLTWSTFQPCRWIIVLMALRREAYWFSAVVLALAR